MYPKCLIKARRRENLDLPSFSDLTVSTKTVVVYSNVEVDRDALFYKLPIYEIKDIPLTKKKKKPNMKLIKAPYGSIISLRRCKTMEYRGIVTNPDKVKLHTLREEDRNGTITDNDLDNLQHIDSRKKSLDFRNQMCCIISLTKENGPIMNMNIMVFKDKMKIVGCRSDEMAYEIVRILWGHTSKIGYTLTDNHPPRYIFSSVMNNINFKLGFVVDRQNLNDLLNQERFSQHVSKCSFDSVGIANVKVKLYSVKPDNHTYVCHEYSTQKIVDPKIYHLSDNVYKNKKDKPLMISLLVFRKSKVILSGKYLQEMKRVYDYFCGIVEEERDNFEEKYFM